MQKRLATWLAAFALGVAAMPMPTAAQSPRSENTPASARARHYRATTPFVRDVSTGQRRLPTDQEVTELVDQLAALTARTSGGATATVAGGTMHAELDGFNGVVLGRATEDGRTETLCVFTLQEGLDFLGLVPVVE